MATNFVNRAIQAGPSQQHVDVASDIYSKRTTVSKFAVFVSTFRNKKWQRNSRKRQVELQCWRSLKCRDFAVGDESSLSASPCPLFHLLLSSFRGNARRRVRL
ncbi:hypothetical protein L596_000924 [Steinernema carpocapsae]|uniref:Uncharacterized protein n=1 Tax=Steinernema carpocapsae TaxID=34508 RepID=A0A4U8UJI4_STECR|nr:hypothetical protein L596_000924 [Steinernema carpocapsae]